MSELRCLLTTIAIVINLFSIAAGQGVGQPERGRDETPLVTAAATAKRVRIAAPSEVVQLRLEVYSEFGNKVFDSEQRGGNLLDWNLQSETGRISDGLYLCVVTIKPLTGAVVQRLALVAVTAEGATLRRAETTQMSAAQAQAISSIEAGAALSFLEGGETPAVTVVTHTGTEGQLGRTRGPLSFRVGDVLTGQDKEQMRITPDGRVGIGVSEPQATLDVAGGVRAHSIKFDDGTVLRSATAAAKTGPDGTAQLLVDGTGTTNRVTKWTNGPAGTLGDSALTEVNGKLGIGTSNPNFELTLFGNDVGVQMASPATGAARGDGFRFGIDSTNKAFLFNQEPTDMYFGTNALERMRILSTGNVGIGTTAPTAKLSVSGSGAFNAAGAARFDLFNTTANVGFFQHVFNDGRWQLGTGSSTRLLVDTAGNLGVGTGPATGHKLDVAGAINTATHYNIGGARVLSVPGLANTFAGVEAGAANTGDGNSFFGRSAGRDNTIGNNNSFFGSNAGKSNQINGANSFFGASAGTNTTGGGNSFFGTSAGSGNQSGGGNSSFGNVAGSANQTGSNNSFFGSFSNAGSISLNNATAIGHRAFVEQSNSLVLGSINGTNGGTSDTNVGIGTTAPTSKLEVRDGEIRSTGPSGGIFAAHNPNNQNARVLLDWFNDGTNDWPRIRYGGNGEGAANGFLIQGGGNSTKLAVLNNGNVGIGTSNPLNRLHVAGSVEGGLCGDVLCTVAFMDQTGDVTFPKVLTLRVNRALPTDNDVFIAFVSRHPTADPYIGSIEGNGSGGIRLVSASGDYAEWLRRLNPAEKIQPGEIVGLYGGRITKNTRDAAQVMAISSGAIVLGNDPGKTARNQYEQVAFIGQVMVRVRGPVKAGDYIVASGLNDGTGIAVSPERITSEQFEQAVGQAWESSADLGVKSVRTAVGLLRRDPTVTRLVDANRRQAKQIKALSDQLTTLESVMKKELAALKFLASSKKKTIGQRASAQSQGRRRAKRSALPKV